MKVLGVMEPLITNYPKDALEKILWIDFDGFGYIINIEDESLNVNLVDKKRRGYPELLK